MKSDRVYPFHIRDCLERIGEYTAEGREGFDHDRRTQDAVIRNLEVIGEAAKQLSEDVRQQYPPIPWRQIAGLRDILIHHYFGVNL